MEKFTFVNTRVPTVLYNTVNPLPILIILKPVYMKQYTHKHIHIFSRPIHWL